MKKIKKKLKRIIETRDIMCDVSLPFPAAALSFTVLLTLFGDFLCNARCAISHLDIVKHKVGNFNRSRTPTVANRRPISFTKVDRSPTLPVWAEKISQFRCIDPRAA